MVRTQTILLMSAQQIQKSANLEAIPKEVRRILVRVPALIATEEDRAEAEVPIKEERCHESTLRAAQLNSITQNEGIILVRLLDSCMLRHFLHCLQVWKKRSDLPRMVVKVVVENEGRSYVFFELRIIRSIYGYMNLQCWRDSGVSCLIRSGDLWHPRTSIEIPSTFCLPLPH